MHAIDAFNNHLPVKVKFGEGISTALPVVIDELGASKVFLMVDAGIEKFNPAAKALIDRLVSISHLTVTIFEKPAGEPTVEMVDDATAAFKSSNSEVVVALGGGSVIDTAKAARLSQQATGACHCHHTKPKTGRRPRPAGWR
jgi:alcohol dehydrogenase